MNIKNYTWVNTFELTKTDPIPTNVTTKTEPKSMKITIALIVGIVGTFIILVCGILIYKWNKKRKERSTLIVKH